MTIKFRAVAKKNPQDTKAPPKYYANKINQGETSFYDLSTKMAQSSTLSRVDIYAVLVGLTEFIALELEDGRVIRLHELGSFSISISSNPSDNEEEVSVSNVKKLKINFRPNLDLKRKVEAFPVKMAKDSC